MDAKGDNKIKATVAALALVGATLVAVGPVHVVGHAVIAGRAAPAVPTNECTDKSYALRNWKVTGTHTWYYNGAGAPATVAGTALTAITSASNTVAKGRNRCGLPADLPTTYSYAGASTARAQISAEATCTGNDNRSVVSWGALPPSYLAYTCTYFRANGTVLASDVLIDNVANAWFTTLPVTCRLVYDLETTMAHERLHTAGLAHVSQSTSAAQTMAPSSGPCSTGRRLLGAGDYAGLKAIANRG
jgi:hypothetical protein